MGKEKITGLLMMFLIMTAIMIQFPVTIHLMDGGGVHVNHLDVE